MMMMIEFFSYDGEYPSLCCGTLRIKINGKEYEISRGIESGGGFEDDENGEICCVEGDWHIRKEFLPEEIQPYAEEIAALINENVEKGCCGGCE